MMRILVGLGLVTLLCVSPALAVTRYVDSGASGCSNPDTDYDPATRACGSGSATVYVSGTPITSGRNATNAGDTLYIRAGTYTEDDPFVVTGKTGTAGSRYTFAGYPGERPVIAPIPIPAGGTARAVITSSTSKFITFRNMVWDGVNHVDGTNGNFVQNADNIIFDDLEIKNWNYNGLYFDGTSNITVENSYIHDQASSCAVGKRWYGMYVHHGSNFTIRNTRINSNPGGGIQAYTGPITGLIIEDVSLNDNTFCASSNVGAILVWAASGNITGVKIHRVEIRNTGIGGVGGFPNGIDIGPASGSFTVTGTEIIGATVYNTQSSTAGEGYGIVLRPKSVNTVIKNSVFAGNERGAINIDGATGTVMTHNACGGSENCTTSNKTTITALTDITVSTSDLQQKAGSVGINAGTSVAGYVCNGVCDLGARESLTFSSGTVTGNTMDLQMDMALNTPFVPGTLGWSVNNGRTVTNVELVGSSVARLTFDGAACTDVQTWTGEFDDATGTATDQALIGGTLNQRLWDTGPITVSNNCAGGGPAYTFTQTYGGTFGAIGAQTTVPALPDVRAGGMFAVRTKKKATGADPPAITTKLQCAVDGENGTYADVPDAFAGGNCPNLRFVGLTTYPGMDLHGTSTTERLTSDFSSMVAGGVVRCATGCEAPAPDLSEDSENEMVWIVELDTDAAVDTVYWFREVLVDGTLLTYEASSKPSITVKAPASSGFSQLDRDQLDRIETLVARPESHCVVTYPDVDTVTLVCSGCRALDTTGRVLTRSIKCLH